MASEDSSVINLEEFPSESVQEVPLSQQRFVIGKWVLGISALFLFLACVQLLCAGDAPEAQRGASKIFEFAKTAIPPVITLILGFYFRGEQTQQTE